MTVASDIPRWPGDDIRPQDISFVLQGPIDPDDLAKLVQGIATLRRLAPGCEIIVSTWQDAPDLSDLDADQLVRSVDPGALPGIRPNGSYPNSVNRQIRSSCDGLARASRAFAVKMRNDIEISHCGFVALYEQFESLEVPGQIVLPSFFTLDPTMFEQVPYHPSDWFHFGPTQTLRDYWAAPFMTAADATHYASRPHAAHSTYLDRKFLCRLAVEQHVAVAYAKRFALRVPAFHNDTRPEVMADHDRFLRHFLIIGDMDQLGISLPKYEWAVRSGFQDLNCITHADWLGIRSRVDRIPALPAVTARRRRKGMMRMLYRTTRPILPLLYSKRLRGVVNKLLETGR